MEWRIHGESIWSGYGVDMEEIFENEMEWSGFGGEVSNFFLSRKLNSDPKIAISKIKKHQLPIGITNEAFME